MTGQPEAAPCFTHSRDLRACCDGISPLPLGAASGNMGEMGKTPSDDKTSDGVHAGSTPASSTCPQSDGALMRPPTGTTYPLRAVCWFMPASAIFKILLKCDSPNPGRGGLFNE